MEKLDLAQLEVRALAARAAGNKIYSEAAKLPKRHPLRFGLLYSMGPASIGRWLRKLVEARIATKTERSIALEADIQCFESWQHADETLDLFSRMFPQAVTRAEAKKRLFALHYGVGQLRNRARTAEVEDSSALTADTVIGHRSTRPDLR